MSRDAVAQVVRRATGVPAAAGVGSFPVRRSGRAEAANDNRASWRQRLTRLLRPSIALLVGALLFLLWRLGTHLF
ncbi:MAG: hypothetical protein QF893_07305 [Alphaproteobacteria bacterium]|jgi:hypothetical protein|nr:hypothetical protein [Alphaproteobacteria bacterium]